MELFRIIMIIAISSSSPAVKISATAHLTPAYLHSSTLTLNHSSWMSSLDNNVPLTQLSLPGTHDSMAFYGGDITQTQTLPLTTQLTAGIRVYDLRCRHISDRFAIHHGSVFQHAWFNNALDEFTRFLIQFPTETIFVRVSKTYTEVNNTRRFEDTFIYYRQLLQYRDYFWYPENSELHEDPRQLTIGTLRGKIVVLDNFSQNGSFGLNYNADFVIQDSYILVTNWDLYSKWEKIKDLLIEANDAYQSSTSKPTTKMYMNYLSGSTGSFPYFVVSGHTSHGSSAPRLATGRTTLLPKWKIAWPDFPRADCFLGICSIIFEGTNVLTWQFIQNNMKCLGYVGIIMTDFPGTGLIESIIHVNYNNNWFQRQREDQNQGNCKELTTGRRHYCTFSVSSSMIWNFLFCTDVEFMLCTFVIVGLGLAILFCLIRIRNMYYLASVDLILNLMMRIGVKTFLV